MISKNNTYTHKLLTMLLLLMVGSGSVWGQTGIWYIGNSSSGNATAEEYTYDSGNPANNYYLVPAADPQLTNKRDAYYSENNYATAGDPGRPFITTYKTNKDNNSIWFISPSDETGFYYIIHAATGKYLIYEPPHSAATNRKSMHLQDINNSTYNPSTNVNFRFAITKSGSGYIIRPHEVTAGNRFFNVANMNFNRYYGSAAPKNNYDHEGIVGLYSSGHVWMLENASNATFVTPVISDISETTNTFTISFPTVSITHPYTTPETENITAIGITSIIYTTNGDEPTVGGPTTYTYSSAIYLEESCTVKARGVYGNNSMTPVVSKVLTPVITSPVITFDNTTGYVTLTTLTVGGAIYYTLDGTTEPTSSSTPYEGPFTISETTTIKAITIKGGENSSVTTQTISQVVTPTIQNNGSNAISITTTTPGATIYYTTDGTDPTPLSLVYSSPLTENVSNVTIKALAVKEGMITSAVGSGSVKLQCATPVISRTGLTFTLSCSSPTDANLYYTLGGGSEVAYTGTPVSFDGDLLPMTVTAVARHNDYTESETASMELKNGTGTSDDPYLIYGATDFSNFVTNVNNGTTSSACYKLGSDVSASGTDAITTEFTGTFDGNGYTISNLGHALFNTVNGGTVKNVILDAVSISGGTYAGAIANKVTGTSSKKGCIYNCGVLAGSVSGSGYVGSIVGQLGDSNNDNCYARVINCYSYATVGGGSEVGGIVGYNDYATTASDIRTMVMNCMFYGDITSGTNISPVYGGENINNLQGGLNTFNYYAYSQLTTATITEYNCALAVEEKYLNRFEFYRLLLNSNKKLAAFYATGSQENADQKMMKWVLETADRTIENPKPYPILKAQGYYPSIINPDFENAPDSVSVGRNKGGKLGKTLSVTISGVGSNAPSGANISKGSLTLQRTDKDFDRFNFNYDKVQLPYYNDVGTGNYTGNRVVTGWKITAITAVDGDPYTSANYDYSKTYASDQAYFDYPNYNFADRKSSNKDLYSVSGRVFSQGAYFDVPYGVTSITIEPYWGKACYIADPNYDVVYKDDYSGKQNVTQTGTQVTSKKTKFNGQFVETSITRSLDSIANNLGGLGPTVYDNALVLVGNLHLDAVPLNGNRPFTMMSVDMDNDHEPDYSLIYHHKNRSNITPIRFDFLTVLGTAQAQKPNGASLICNFTIFKTRGWFEVTNTAFMYSSQIEYENGALGKNGEEAITKMDAPLILLGGVFDQFVSTQSSTVDGHTIYIHVGSNVWINSFGLGTHSDGKQSTPHVPVSVTGGDFEEFYLTGTYNANSYIKDDNAECYISGGRFGEVAGASLEQIGNDNTTKGNVHWQIYNADITSFFGGGINDAKPVKGNITTDIFNSNVTLFCGGPKFGNMASGKTVTTTAEGCIFGKYFGAGYGGTSLAKKKYYDKDGDQNWTTLQGYYTTDKGKYFNGTSTGSSQISDKDYGKKGPGVATDFDYEFFVWSSGATGARFFVKFASFSLAQCNDVSSTLKKCTVETNFYGGGNLGKVVGTATSVLENCTVKGNVYGAGYSASLPTVEVRDAGFTKAPNYNAASGMFESGDFSGTTTFTWQNAEVAGVTLSNGNPGSNLDDNILYTDVTLDHLGEVQTTNLTITGTTTVGESVYGGGEESGVGGNTTVTVNSGSIGVENTGTFGYRWGNVYGGGKGKIEIKSDGTSELAVKSKDDLDAGQVKGNTTITINGTETTTRILHNVYGGGAVGSVGTFTRDADGMPTACQENTGLATVTINGGTIGHDHPDTGMVDGSSRGWEGDPNGTGAFAFLNQLAWVNNTNVTIGLSTSNDEDKGPTVYGSVYGGGENGHNFGNGVITLNKGIVGYRSGTWDCGNIYGAGCGTDTFERDDNDNGTIDEGESGHHNPMAGIVRGTTSITVNGGHVLRNVYGGGSMGSVGTYTYDANGLPTTCDAGTGSATVNINGGIIGLSGTDYGYVFGGPRGSLAETAYSASVRETLVNINAGADVLGSVFGGGEAGIIKEKVVVNMNGGEVDMDVYGGGALANTNTDVLSGSSAETLTTTVNLKGGKILRNVYGGALGQTEDAASGLDNIEAKVYGNVLVELNNGIADNAKGCVVLGSIFGCNNLNGTPMGDVKVHIYKTQNDAATCIANAPASGETPAVEDAKVANRYDVTAVYGGGNQSAYVPADLTNNKTEVIIDGCGLTSIQQVYGGGNAACTPATNVTVNGTFEILELFGGGNGLDNILINGVTMPNPGANVGYKNYSEYYKEDGIWKVRDKSDADTKEKRLASSYVYGTGKAAVNIYGGTVHRVFGGSNTKGNVRQTAVTLLDEEGECEFCVDEAYGGGKSAEMDAEAQLLMACIPGLKEVYGGAEAADVRGNVTLNITNGTFDRVFGGNNLSGTIGGSITINVEEIGCRPVIIGELYGGGNQAGYSVYGYNSDGKPTESGTTPLYDDPQVNVMSFTSIGNIFGGGFGDGATMVGNPTVNVNVVHGKYYDDTKSVVGENAETPNHYPIPSHAKGKMGAVNNVFGGGNAAKVIGNTNVNIATLKEVYVMKQVSVGDNVSSLYTRKDDGTYIAATGTAVDGTTYYEKVDVLGADIRGNVYGGGNNADVTGNSKVIIDKKDEGE